MPKPSPHTWLASAGRPDKPGDPLNVPLVPASNFVLGGDREYARDGGTPTWAALEDIIGGLESGQALAFSSWLSPPAWRRLPPCSTS
jgi:cystathionine gamma-synthase